MIALLLAPLYILINWYVVRWLLRWMGACHHLFRSKPAKITTVVLYILLASTVLTGFLIPFEPVHRVLRVVGNYFLGTFLYILLAILVLDLVRIILKRTRWMPKEPQQARRLFVGVGAGVIVLIASLSGFGAFHARQIQVESVDLTVEKACKLDSLKVVLVADLHLGYSVGAGQVEQMVDKINAQSPDLVCLAGDIFDNDFDAIDNPEGIAALLRGITSRYGVYACYGNHDIAETLLAGFTFGADGTPPEDPRFSAFLESAGIRLLADETVCIDGALYLCGRKDYSKSRKLGETRLSPAELTASLDPALPLFVLDHQPRELQELAAAGVDVDLSGHTHDGQLFPGNLLVGLLWDNPCGVRQIGGMASCVTSGVGMWGPAMRIGTDSEILVLNIEFTP